ncbi:MAG: S8 family serine peptidase, partial [Phycisphaerales bacterium]|nr:S8 family serine peptidase [Phycisphaerales bacterium]
MTTPPKLGSMALACSLIMMCGLPASFAIAAPEKGVSVHGQPASSLAVMMSKARSALNLLPGDELMMQAAAESPMVFVEIAHDREFTRELIVHANTGRGATALSRVSPSLVKKSTMVEEYVISVPEGLSEGEFAAMLMSTGDYLFVEPNYRLFPLLTPNDSQFNSSWQHTRIQSTLAWDLHTGDSDVIVAVCDSGVDTNHPDLQAALVPGYNAVNNLAQDDGGLVEDVNGHGTFVSGCAAAQGNNGTGVVGVGWDFRVMPIRVSNNSSGTASGFDILEGARWAVDNGAKAINASFSGGTSGSNQTTAKYIIDRGGLFFWA